MIFMGNIEFEKDPTADERIVYRDRKQSLSTRIMIGLGVKNHFQAQMILLVLSVIVLSITTYVISDQFSSFIARSQTILTTQTNESNISTSTNIR